MSKYLLCRLFYLDPAHCLKRGEGWIANGITILLCFFLITMAMVAVSCEVPVYEKEFDF